MVFFAILNLNLFYAFCYAKVNDTLACLQLYSSLYLEWLYLTLERYTYIFCEQI